MMNLTVCAFNSNSAIVTKQKVLSAGLRFLLQPTTKAAMPLNARKTASAALAKKDVTTFFQCIRGFAHAFVQIACSDAFWHLVDACGFFLDAIGDHWKYLTEERRQTYLAWAAEMADNLFLKNEN